MNQPTIARAAGARPNFMKVTPLFHAQSERKESARKAGIDLRVSIVHTGKHYDPNMSDIFRTGRGILDTRISDENPFIFDVTDICDR